jgi:hypothetical protein
VFAGLAKAQFLTSGRPAPPAATTTTDSPPVAANEQPANRLPEDAAE